jgi:hypothetical protein
MYNHPLSKHYEASEETNGEATCNSWGFVSGLTHAYFEEEDDRAREILFTILSDSKASSVRVRGLLRQFKRYRTLPVLREIQCILATTAEEQVDSVLSNFEPEEVSHNSDEEDPTAYNS